MRLRPRYGIPLFLTLALTTATSCHSPDGGRAGLQPSTPLRQMLEAGLDSLVTALAKLDSTLGTSDISASRAAFRAARRIYKHHAALIVELSPTTAAILNGPPPEDDDGPPEPLGRKAAFQRIEATLFGDSSSIAGAVDALRSDVRVMSASVGAFRKLTAFTNVSAINALDAARAELARTSTLWLAGVDSDESGDEVVESAAAMEGLRAVAAGAGATAARDALTPAIEFLASHRDPVTLDRLSFMVQYAEPAAKAIQQARRDAGAPDTTLRVVWRPEAASVFESGALDARAYAPAYAIRPSAEVVALGKRLFGDRRLSGPQSRACSDCHIPARAFTDGMARHGALIAGRAVARNTPTLLNIALHPAFFADGRAATLEDQAAAVLSSETEMASSPALATARLNADAGYRQEFARALRRGPDLPIDEGTVRGVIATYLRSLVALDSRFDAAVRGDTLALDADERSGFIVFMGKGRCGSCHLLPLFSGVAAPAFTRSEPEIIGVPSRADTARAGIDADPGLAGVDGAAVHRHAFNVPTLRNVALTAPYMHNGAYGTLEQVVDFYDRGGGAGIGAALASQTLSRVPLRLSAPEKRALIAFLRSLTDRQYDRR